jgi:hypothetical protein
MRIAEQQMYLIQLHGGRSRVFVCEQASYYYLFTVHEYTVCRMSHTVCAVVCLYVDTVIIVHFLMMILIFIIGYQCDLGESDGHGQDLVSAVCHPGMARTCAVRVTLSHLIRIYY